MCAPVSAVWIDGNNANPTDARLSALTWARHHHHLPAASALEFRFCFSVLTPFRFCYILGSAGFRLVCVAVQPFSTPLYVSIKTSARQPDRYKTPARHTRTKIRIQLQAEASRYICIYDAAMSCGYFVFFVQLLALLLSNAALVAVVVAGAICEYLLQGQSGKWKVRTKNANKILPATCNRVEYEQIPCKVELEKW